MVFDNAAMSIMINGFFVGLSLIIAIGPQNAFLLRQGIARVGVTAAIITCLLSDILLILGGTAGVGVIVGHAPIVLTALKWFGFCYLLYFAYTCFRDAWRPTTTLGAQPDAETAPPAATSDTSEHQPAPGATGSSVAVVHRTRSVPATKRHTWVQPALAAAAMTWLNPAAYLDALVMLGNLANQHGEVGRWWFAGGAIAASAAWFPTLGYSAAKLAKPLSNPRINSIVNAAIGVIMVLIACRLILH